MKKLLIIILLFVSISIVGFFFKDAIHRNLFPESYRNKEIRSVYNEIEDLTNKLSWNLKTISFLENDAINTYELQINQAKYEYHTFINLGLEEEAAREIYDVSINFANKEYDLSGKLQETLKVENSAILFKVDSLIKIKYTLINKN